MKGNGLAKISRKKFVTEWVKALRSGKFRQTKGKLGTKTKCKNGQYGYCCLGVACEVGEKLGIKGAGFANKTNHLPHQYRDDMEPGEWFRKIMGDRDPQLTNEYTCAEANDFEGWKFSKIAKALEDKYL